jgi:hypothetical protein
MRIKIHELLGAIVVLGSTWAQAQGTITGTVLDEVGMPLAKAEVHVAPKGPFAGHRIVQFHETDSSGHFLIEHVPWGTYVLMAGKEDVGYPDTKMAFYSNLAVPTVSLTPDTPTLDVDLKLGPKAGILDLGVVTDKSTGKEVRSAAITLRRAGGDFSMTASTTEGRILVPSSTEVIIGISAPGYKPWPPQEQMAAKGRILLKPDEVLKLQVYLDPEDPGAPQEKK